MRIRTIKPEFWTHPVMVRQSDAAKLLAIGLLNYADDEGYFYADPKLVRAALRPLDEDSTIVRGCLEQLSRIGFIEVREHSSHGPVGRVVSFDDHQRVDRPTKSKIRPLFAELSPQDATPEDPSLFDDTSTNARRTLAANVPQERKGKEQGKEGKGKEGAADAAGVGDEHVLPFPSPEFASAWTDWLAYRRERRLNAYKPTSLKAQFAQLTEWGEAGAIASIRESIRQQWQGLFPPKANPASPPGASRAHTAAPTAADHGKGFFHGV